MRDIEFPDQLLADQRALDQAREELSALAAPLPWSVEPMPGWSSDPDRDRGYRSERPDSPGWTPEQLQAVTALRRRVLELSIAVSTHPYWASVTEGVVEARMALKRRAHEKKEEAEAA
ncbi:hypothetical protein [Streptomyces mobaraensis]|uniref:Uncharacterized protein n=1 Tax=Streptomyces mobaraensis TaxID=35621 RepID=A0A5N5VWV5_STRMB|nr:hypothetical protein [Streptomyces mobaraensis]KAB7832516.1 hypothetical protein FRZ00_34795 [Streptomyces mobaraensis]